MNKLVISEFEIKNLNEDRVLDINVLFIAWIFDLKISHCINFYAKGEGTTI